MFCHLPDCIVCMVLGMREIAPWYQVDSYPGGK